jgi:hypothetical protein
LFPFGKNLLPSQSNPYLPFWAELPLAQKSRLLDHFLGKARVLDECGQDSKGLNGKRPRQVHKNLSRCARFYQLSQISLLINRLPAYGARKQHPLLEQALTWVSR